MSDESNPYKDLIEKIELLKSRLLEEASIASQAEEVPKFGEFPTKMKTEEKASEPEFYEGYRTYPVIVKVKDKCPDVYIDDAFKETCYDFGRTLAMSGYDAQEGYDKAKDFITKLVCGPEKIMRNSVQYDKDMTSINFGMAFVNKGFTEWDRKLTPAKGREITIDMIDLLRTQGYFGF